MTAPTIAKPAGHACPWCRQLVDIDTIPPWWSDHANLAELYAYLSGSDCPEDDALDPSSVQYFLEKPWKWTDEYSRMRAEKARTEKAQTK